MPALSILAKLIILASVIMIGAVQRSPSTTSAKTDLASDPPALRSDSSAGYSASHASCAP